MSFREHMLGFFKDAQDQAMGQARVHFDSRKEQYGNNLKSGLKKTIKFVCASILSISCWFLGLLGFVFSILIKPESLTIASNTLGMISFALTLVPLIFLGLFFYKKL